MNIEKIKRLTALRETPGKVPMNLDIMDSAGVWLYIFCDKHSISGNEWIINEVMPKNLKTKEFFQKLTELTCRDVQEFVDCPKDIYDNSFVLKNINNDKILDIVEKRIDIEIIEPETLIKIVFKSSSLREFSRTAFKGIGGSDIEYSFKFLSLYLDNLISQKEVVLKRLDNRAKFMLIDLFQTIANFDFELGLNNHSNKKTELWKHFIQICENYGVVNISHERNRFSSRFIPSTSPEQTLESLPELKEIICAISTDCKSLLPLEIFAQYIDMNLLTKIYQKSPVIFENYITYKINNDNHSCIGNLFHNKSELFLNNDFKLMFGKIPRLLFLFTMTASGFEFGAEKNILSQLSSLDDKDYIDNIFNYLLSEKCVVKPYLKIKLINIILHEGYPKFYKYIEANIKYIEKLVIENHYYYDISDELMNKISMEAMVKLARSLSNWELSNLLKAQTEDKRNELLKNLYADFSEEELLDKLRAFDNDSVLDLLKAVE